MNKIILRVACTAAFVLSVSTAFAQSEPLKTARLTPDELKRAPTQTGNQQAIIAGDPQKTGMYAYRTKFAANFRNQPHYHPDERIVTIVSGTLYVGYGEQFDESKLRALPAGSIFTEPAKQPHFVWAKDGEVIIQVIGYGPSATTPVQSNQ
jgi:quercetin dioxygenase-like cupin family protein